MYAQLWQNQPCHRQSFWVVCVLVCVDVWMGNMFGGSVTEVAKCTKSLYLCRLSIDNSSRKLCFMRLAFSTSSIYRFIRFSFFLIRRVAQFFSDSFSIFANGFVNLPALVICNTVRLQKFLRAFFTVYEESFYVFSHHSRSYLPFDSIHSVI